MCRAEAFATQDKRIELAELVLDALRKFAVTHMVGAPFDRVLLLLNGYDSVYHPELFSAPVSDETAK